MATYTGSYDYTWNTWTSTTSSTATSPMDGIWYYWTSPQTGTATVSTSTTTTWYTWVQYETTDETSEQREARMQRQAEEIALEKKRREEKARKDAIREKKARQLLKEVLTKEQDKDLEEKGYFDLVSVKSGQRYRVHKGRSRNINKIDQCGRVCGTVCFHPRDDVHDYDTMAIQKLMLENDEERVRQVANFS